VNAEDRNANYPEVQSGTADILRDAVLVRGRTPDDDPSLEQIEIYRQMPGVRRLKLAEQMFWMARRLKTAGVRHQHPDWPEEEVLAEVNRIFRNARE
jgi:hypothetical protein